MVKLLLMIIPVAIVIGAIIYFAFFYKQQVTSVALSGFDSAPYQTQIDTLKQRVSDLENKQSGLTPNNSSTNSKSSPAPTINPSDLGTRVTNIEKTLSDLQVKVALLQQASPALSTQVQTSSANKYPVYIPLGTGGQLGDKNWNTTGTYQVTIDSANYSGYKNMQLEVNAQMIQSGGQANFRVFNKTDNSAVSGSDTSTTSTSYVWISSNGFTLSSGSKTYILQIQSTEGVNTNIQSARIKVNF